jgi:hypothetical protein
MEFAAFDTKHAGLVVEEVRLWRMQKKSIMRSVSSFIIIIIIIIASSGGFYN